ncbi:MAG: TauD/TfdA family dioxygenase [Geminicoccaceae bacterium]
MEHGDEHPCPYAEPDAGHRGQRDRPCQVDRALAARLRRYAEEHALVVVRGQAIMPEQQVALTRLLGEPELHPEPRFRLDGIPEIVQVGDRFDGDTPTALPERFGRWRSDLSYLERPGDLSVLVPSRLPEAGALIEFASMRAAFAALPQRLVRNLERLSALHDYAHRARRYGALGWLWPSASGGLRPVEHPVVRTDPSGRPVLFVNECFTTRIIEHDEEESSRLLALLFHHQNRPEFRYAHRLQPDDVLLWDNRTVIHRTPVGSAGPRLAHRTTVRGERPVAAAGASDLLLALTG